MSQEFIARVSDTIEKYAMLEGVSSLLCGYSGGADSTALLFALREICGERNISLGAAHIDHMIRGGEALRDFEHCRGVCERLCIPFYGLHIDVPAISARDGVGLEETARRERYAAFERLRAGCGFEKTAVAHNSGDNLETVLFNLARGGALRGLCGIAPVRDDIIRPLIETSREEITAFLSGLGESFVTDSTNSDDAYTRNFIRHELVPRFKRLNPAAERNVTRTCSLLRRDAVLLDALSLDENAADISLSPAASDALTAGRIRAAYEAVSDGGRLESTHIEAALRLLREGRLWSSVSLPGRLRLTVTRSGFEIKPDERAEKDGGDSPEIMLETDVLAALPRGGKAVIVKDIKENINIYKLSIHKSFDSDRIIGTVQCRYRLPGDCIRCGGHSKSVKKLLCEKKTAPEKRDSIPFFCDGEGIFWIPGVAVRDGVSPGDDMHICAEFS